MSLNIEGSSCARCKAYLFKEDDVVYCPICGAPHHRECYNALGHCALEELHGTDREYSKEKEMAALAELSQNTENSEDTNSYNLVSCRMCGEKYDGKNRNCPRCNAPNLSAMNGFEGFDFLGGVPKDYKIDEDVTADEAKRFVIANTHRYIPKFATLNKAKKLSWNWFAFLFPCGWMLSRKMFKSGIIIGILTILANLITYPLNLTLYNLGVTTSASSADLIVSIAEVLPQIDVSAIIFAFVGFFADIIIRLFSGMYGDYMYKSHTVAQIKKIKSQSDDIDYSYRKNGGVNIFNFFIATLILQYVPTILIYFI